MRIHSESAPCCCCSAFKRKLRQMQQQTDQTFSVFVFGCFEASDHHKRFAFISTFTVRPISATQIPLRRLLFYCRLLFAATIVYNLWCAYEWNVFSTTRTTFTFGAGNGWWWWYSLGVEKRRRTMERERECTEFVLRVFRAYEY